MSNSAEPVVSRRVVLGGAAAALVGTGLVHTPAAFADNSSAQLIRLRRDLHRHPESAGQERRTARLVAQRLRSAGLDVTTGVGGYGVVGVLKGARPGRTVAYRADMDAVPPNEQVPGGSGVAHVCGHDIHTTVGVGVAEVLARMRGRLSGTVVFVFQPAEESLTGAAAMIADGVLSATRPSEIHALHCAPFPVGQFAVTPGFGMPGLDRGTVTLTGSDAAERARRLADEIRGLGTVSLPITPDDLERVVAESQIPNGPLAKFVFMNADSDDGSATVSLSYRCWPEQRYLDIRADIRRLARSYDGAAVSFPDDPFPALRCPEREGRAIRQYLRHAFGQDNVTTMHAAFPFKGEDFALFLNKLPGTYTFLGVRAPGAGIETSFPHFAAFTPDERAIGHGVRAMAGWLAERTRTD